MKNIGILLIVVGIALIGYWGYQSSQNSESISLGDVELSASKSTSPIPAVVGGIAFVGGLVIMMSGKKR